MNFLVFTPTYADALHPLTIASVVGQRCAHTLVWELGRHNPYPPPDKRNVAAQYRWAQALALAGEYDALVTVEHDMVLPPHAIDTLWADGADVVYGVYTLRHNTNMLNALQYVNDKNIGESLTTKPVELALAQKAGRWRVSGVGFGCTLIRKDTLERIIFEPDEHGGAPDMPFARACNAAGIVQMARFDVECGHVENGEVLPVRMGAARVRVLAKATVNINDPQCPHLDAGNEYEISTPIAKELQRAGFAEVLP